MNEIIELLLGMCLVIVAIGCIIWFLDAPIDSCKKIYRLCKRLISKIIPQNRGVGRLCLVVSILFVFGMFVEIPVSSGLGQVVCGKRSCHIFGEPSWITAFVVFCIPFVVAKVIEFIVEGFRGE